jgi:outer membrane protein assembly factor BamE (lipoprotein component of BamABCDE complex)
MKTRGVLAIAVVVAAAGLSGCWESSDVTIYEQGVYKGKKDPLLQQQASAREEALKKRFELVQVDR